MAREQWDIQATGPGASSLSISAAAAQSFQGRPIFHCPKSSLVAQMAESPCNVGGLGSIPRLGRSPREGNGNHSCILAWRIPWTEGPVGYSPWGHTESVTTEQLKPHTTMYYVSLKICVIFGEVQIGWGRSGPGLGRTGAGCGIGWFPGMEESKDERVSRDSLSFLWPLGQQRAEGEAGIMDS